MPDQLLSGLIINEILADPTYAHVVLQHHTIMMANGALAESLYLGAGGQKAMSSKALREITAILPDALLLGNDWTLATTELSGSRTRRLVGRHLKNNKPLLSSPTAQNAAARHLNYPH